jgi:hypothetical protein
VGDQWLTVPLVHERFEVTGYIKDTGYNKMVLLMSLMLLKDASRTTIWMAGGHVPRVTGKGVLYKPKMLHLIGRGSLSA